MSDTPEACSCTDGNALADQDPERDPYCPIHGDTPEAEVVRDCCGTHPNQHHLDDCLRAQGWETAAQEFHRLHWLHDFALSDALAANPFKATAKEGPR